MVYLIAQPTVSGTGDFPKLKPLAEYGNIRVIVEAGDYPAFTPGKIFEKVKDRLKDFDAENDYIAFAGGDTLAALMVGSALAQFGHHSFRWLRFERGRDPKNPSRRTDEGGTYTPVDVMLYIGENEGDTVGNRR